MLDLHRLRAAAVTMLAIPQPPPPPKEKGGKPPAPTDIVGLDSAVRWGSTRDAEQAQQRLLFLASAAELEDVMSIRSSMIRHCPNIRLHSNLQDANIYIFANWVLGMLDSDRFSSIKT